MILFYYTMNACSIKKCELSRSYVEELYYPRLNEEKPPGGANRLVVDRPVITFPLF